nr:integrase, catalytic region, zinc finger, CCHC-type, peptidase aspartic, catalytic [Tanacetum cinerariifolium]
MSTLVDYMIVFGAENRPPMLDKSMYNSWESHMLQYIKGKKNGRMMLESIKNGPFVYPTVEEDGQIRKKKYVELTEQEQLQNDCDVQATNSVLQGLPPDVYALVNHFPQSAYHSLIISPQPQAEFFQLDSGLAVLGERHMARQCTQLKRPRNVIWFNEKLMMAEAHESGQVLDEEQLTFLAGPGITDCHDVQPIIIHNAAFQTDELDAYDSDCDDISSTKAV